MDIKAYTQIDKFADIMKANDIFIPRLRGYRWMATEVSLSSNEIAESIKSHEGTIYERAVCSCPRFRPESDIFEYSQATDRLKKKYLIQEKRTETDGSGAEYSYEETVGFRWELLHGRNRKALKFSLKNGRKAVIRQLETFNKYVGRADVMYIHARIGGQNWSHYGGAEISREPWFLEKVDDYFDDTYCDIYVKLKEIPQVEV